MASLPGLLPEKAWAPSRAGGTTLPRLIGGTAPQLMLSGEPRTANTLGIGPSWNEVVSPGEARARRRSHRCWRAEVCARSAGDQAAFATTGIDRRLPKACASNARRCRLFDSPDYAEGLAAFRQTAAAFYRGRATRFVQRFPRSGSRRCHSGGSPEHGTLEHIKPSPRWVSNGGGLEDLCAIATASSGQPTRVRDHRGVR